MSNGVRIIKFDPRFVLRPEIMFSERGAQPRFGKLSWAEADALPLLVLAEAKRAPELIDRVLRWDSLRTTEQVAVQTAEELELCGGGIATNVYQAKADPEHVYVAGKEWSRSVESDRVLNGYQALLELRGVLPEQTPRLDGVNAIQREDGAFITVYEAEALFRGEQRESEYLDFYPAPMDTEELFGCMMDDGMVAAFTRQMLFNYQQLGGRLPRFIMQGRDVLALSQHHAAGGKGRWFAGSNPPLMGNDRTYRFVFTWCDGLEKVAPGQVANFIVRMIADREDYSDTLVKPEEVELVVRRTVAREILSAG